MRKRGIGMRCFLHNFCAVTTYVCKAMFISSASRLPPLLDEKGIRTYVFSLIFVRTCTYIRTYVCM